MPKTLLQWIGALAVVGGCALSVAGLVNLKDHFTVTFSEDGAQNIVDPISLLRDDLTTFQNDFQAFVGALEGGLQTLGTQLDESGTAGRAELAHRLDLHETRLTRLVERQAELSGRIDGLVQVLQTGSSNVLTEAAPLESGFEPARETVNRAVDADPASRPAENAPTQVKPHPKFLSFSVPSGKFQFDRAQHFEVIASLSRVGFDAKSTLHDFTGVTSEVRGSFEMALADPKSGCQGNIEVQAGSLRTGVDGRDEEMASRLQVQMHPQLSFQLRDLQVAAVDASTMTVSGDAVGRLFIAGQSREVRFPVTLSVDASRRVQIVGDLTIKMSDYGVEPPSQLGVISVQDEVKVWISLRARATGPAAHLANRKSS